MGEKITWEDMYASIQDGHVVWQKFLDDRAKKEILFDEIYAEQFAHGTDGHNARLIIAKLANLLETMCKAVTFKDIGE